MAANRMSRFVTTGDIRPPATDDEWASYHAIRRRVLFELRGNAGVYDAHHPDEHRPGRHPFLFWVAGAPLGVIRIDVEGSVATFRRVAIREDVQRRGHGRRLLAAAERFAREQGCTHIESHADPGAVQFYERCGFTRAEPARPSDVSILMRKSLT
jgi:GNAT superfamily N-acetyltransferase